MGYDEGKNKIYFCNYIDLILWSLFFLSVLRSVELKNSVLCRNTILTLDKDVNYQYLSYYFLRNYCFMIKR